VVEGASGRGAAGGDIRFRDIPSEGIEVRVAKLEAALENRTIAMPLLRMLRRALLQERLVLPVVSSTLGRVFELLERDDVQIDDLALAIESDPALATKLVGVANSGFYGGFNLIVSVRDALMRTGLARRERRRGSPGSWAGRADGRRFESLQRNPSHRRRRFSRPQCGVDSRYN